jgi:photosystem II stability/assembly factor-like uncharacterized protein
MVDEMEMEEIQDTVYALVASPAFEQDGICFSAQASGLRRSVDGGKTWNSVYGSLKLELPLQTIAAAISPNFAQDQTLFAGVPGGVLRSTDGGNQWTAATFPEPAPFLSAMAVSPNFEQDGMVFTGTMEDGVLRSDDRGATWVAWNFGLFDRSVFALAVSPNYSTDRTVFIGTESGLFRSNSGGRGWRDLNFPGESAPILSLAISPEYAKDQMLFAGTESAGLFWSEDRGQTWKQVEALEVQGAINAILLSKDFPVEPDILVVFDNGLMVSRDGGKSWAEWNSEFQFEEGLVSVAAPHGLKAGATLLVGMSDGQVLAV